MAIAEGDRVPEATLRRIGPNGPEEIALTERLAGRRVVLFAVPGAFTPTCHSAHMPSFIRTKDDFDEKGIDEIICVAVNDVFVLAEWARSTGAEAAGITCLADPEGELAEAMGLTFDAAAVGLIHRSQRYALVADDGVIRTLRIEEARGTCEVTGGEALLATL